MTLLPPSPDVCQVCAVDHQPEETHDARSLFYGVAFQMRVGRAPTWADASAHCSDEYRAALRDVLASNGIPFTETEEPVEHFGDTDPATLASLPVHPESVPVNHLVDVDGTPLSGSQPLDGLDFVRAIATARIVMPKSVVRLSAGRETMSRELQALCFLAGAGSIFVGDELLTTPNPDQDTDTVLFRDLGLEGDEAGRQANA